MTTLIVMPTDDPTTVTTSTTDQATIAAELARLGVVYERWSAIAPLAADADQEAVLAAYADDVARIQAQGYVTVDVARIAGDPDDEAFLAKAAEARGKFLAEHRHADDEVRFFVEGSGAFYLRMERPDGAEAVHVVLCEQGDYLFVPKNTRHWFDMGTRPRFTAIRFFQVEDGWVGDFTGDPIASGFPSYDELVAEVG